MTLQRGMSNKERRMLKAARMRWQENKDLKTIASELNLAYQTVKNYFSGDEMERFERFYSESDKQLLEAQLQRMVRDGTSAALDLEAELRTGEDVDDRTRLKVLREAQKIPERHIEMLQELGILEKPTEKRKVESEADTDELREELVEGLKEKREELKQES